MSTYTYKTLPWVALAALWVLPAWSKDLEAEIKAVKAPLMMHYAGDDARINDGIPAFRALLDEYQIAYSLNMYPGTGHGFHNDSSAARYAPIHSALNTFRRRTQNNTS